MRRFLFAVVLLEAVALMGVGGLAVFADLDRLGRRPPAVPVFRPPVYDAVIGDQVRYRVTRDAELTGFLEYEVVSAVEYRPSTLGREFVMRVTTFDAGGRQTSTRLMRLRPRAVRIGFLPPRPEEDDDYPSGARPVVKRIVAERFPFRREQIDGFRIDAVIPRESLTEVAERYWFADEIPVFGVARWQRGDEDLVVDTSTSQRPQ